MSIRDLTPWSWGRRLSEPEGDLYPMQELHQRLDRLFDDIFAGFDQPPVRRASPPDTLLAPRIDVWESDSEYRFSAELPGVDESDVDVSLLDGVLTIKGEKRSETKEEKDRYLRAERSYGAFQRSFSLPPGIDPGEVRAIFQRGVLTVTAAKSPKAKSAVKRIEIK